MARKRGADIGNFAVLDQCTKISQCRVGEKHSYPYTPLLEQHECLERQFLSHDFVPCIEVGTGKNRCGDGGCEVLLVMYTSAAIATSFLHNQAPAIPEAAFEIRNPITARLFVSCCYIYNQDWLKGCRL